VDLALTLALTLALARALALALARALALAATSRDAAWDELLEKLGGRGYL
jgi:hypothetical protein